MDKPGSFSTPTAAKMDSQEAYTPTKHTIDEDSSSSRASIKEYGTFLTEGLDGFHVPIDKYEGRHRYDARFRWEENEEKKLVRKVRRDAQS